MGIAEMEQLLPINNYILRDHFKRLVSAWHLMKSGVCPLEAKEHECFFTETGGAIGINIFQLVQS